MKTAAYPTLYNVRTPEDINAIEEDALERYNVPDNWLLLELLGLTAVYEIINSTEETLPPVTSALPKRPFLMDDIVNKSVPLYLRM